MKRFAILVMVSIFALGGSTGCMFGENDDELAVSMAAANLSGTRQEPLRLCHWMDDLDGLEATVFRVKGHERMVAVKSGGRVVCVDDVGMVGRSGIRNRADRGEEPCDFCGTPLPAELIVEVSDDGGE